MSNVLKLILPEGELLAAPWTPGEELLAAPWALEATPLQRSRETKPAERKIAKAINGQLLSIRSRIATVTQAATTSVAQTEFAASQNRQEVTKLDENEADVATEIRLCTALDEKLLMYRLTLVVTLIVVFMLLNESGFSL